MKNTLLAASIVAAVSFVSVNTYAADTGGYIGASFGQTSSDALDDLESIPGVSVDDSDTGYKIFAGYSFNANFAIEGFYTDLGEISATNGVTTASVSLDSLGVAGLAILPLNDDFGLFAKVGYQRWDAELKATGVSSTNEDGSDAVLGLGVTYDVQNVSLRGEFERYAIDGDDVDLLSVGIAYNF
jgi:OOP family OmpA-OmpF porin